MPVLRVFESKYPQVLVLRAVFTSRVKVHPFIRHRGNRGPERLAPARPPQVDGTHQEEGSEPGKNQEGGYSKRLLLSHRAGAVTTLERRGRL